MEDLCRCFGVWVIEGVWGCGWGRRGRRSGRKWGGWRRDVVADEGEIKVAQQSCADPADGDVLDDC